jgi:predicted permease
LMPENFSSLTLMLISLFWIAVIFIPIILIRRKVLKKDWRRRYRH